MLCIFVATITILSCTHTKTKEKSEVIQKRTLTERKKERATLSLNNTASNLTTNCKPNLVVSEGIHVYQQE